MNNRPARKVKSVYKRKIPKILESDKTADLECHLYPTQEDGRVDNIDHVEEHRNIPTMDESLVVHQNVPRISLSPCVMPSTLPPILERNWDPTQEDRELEFYDIAQMNPPLEIDYDIALRNPSERIECKIIKTTSK